MTCHEHLRGSVAVVAALMVIELIVRNDISSKNSYEAVPDVLIFDPLINTTDLSGLIF